jgi:hypothetical protein
MEDGIMAECKNLNQCGNHTGSIFIEAKEIDNVKRILTMLEKALERILRRNYYNRKQYPPIALEIEEEIAILRGWIKDYQLYSPLQSFRLQIGLAMKELESKIGQLMALCNPSAGKKRIKKNSRLKNTLRFANRLMPCWII